MSFDEWSELPFRVHLGQRVRGTILRVNRWGVLLDLNLPFPGFMDRLHIGNNLDRYRVGEDIEVVVVQFAEYNQQIRVRPLADEERQSLLLT
jgi:ribosomal protein S1